MDAILAALIGLGGAIVGAAIAWLAAKDAAKIQVTAAEAIAKASAERAAREIRVREVRQFALETLAWYATLAATLRSTDGLEALYRAGSARQTQGRHLAYLVDAPSLRQQIDGFIAVDRDLWNALERDRARGLPPPDLADTISAELGPFSERALTLVKALGDYVITGEHAIKELRANRRHAPGELCEPGLN